MKYASLLLLALSGCASTSSVLSREASETVHSPKSVTEVTFCLANKNNAPALTAPDGAQVVQVKSAIGAAGMIFSVYPEGAGSRIEIRKPISLSIAKHRGCY